MKALTIGGATLDTIIEYENIGNHGASKNKWKHGLSIIEEGAKVEVKKQRSFSGGGATNAAISLIKLGYNVSFFGQGWKRYSWR